MPSALDIISNYAIDQKSSFLILSNDQNNYNDKINYQKMFSDTNHPINSHLNSTNTHHKSSKKNRKSHHSGKHNEPLEPYNLSNSHTSDSIEKYYDNNLSDEDLDSHPSAPSNNQTELNHKSNEPEKSHKSNHKSRHHIEPESHHQSKDNTDLPKQHKHRSHKNSDNEKHHRVKNTKYIVVETDKYFKH